MCVEYAACTADPHGAVDVDTGWLGCAAAAPAITRIGAQAGLPYRAEVDPMVAEIRPQE
jgi:hypothetical protein